MTTRIALTTIVRDSALEVPSGWLRIYDLDGRRQLAEAPLPDPLHRARDTNPRGGLRGGRGVAATADRLAIAINDRILVLGSSWQMERVLSHRWMGGLHELAADDRGVWATCSDNDLLLGLDWEGRLRGSWHWRSDRRLRCALGLPWMPPFDRWADHRDPFGGGLRFNVGHVNTVTLDGPGMLVGLGLVRRPPRLFRSAVLARAKRLAERAGFSGLATDFNARWRRPGAVGSPNPQGLALTVTPGALEITKSWPAAREWTWVIVELDDRSGRQSPKARVLARGPAVGMPAHNAVPYGETIVVNDSSRGMVMGVCRRTGKVERSVSFAGQRPFPRGLLHLGGDRFLVGTQRPATLNVVDLDSEQVQARITLPDDRGESIFAIAPVPEAFARLNGQLPDRRAEWPIVGADARDGAPHRDAPSTPVLGD